MVAFFDVVLSQLLLVVLPVGKDYMQLKALEQKDSEVAAGMNPDRVREEKEREKRERREARKQTRRAAKLAKKQANQEKKV